MTSSVLERLDAKSRQLVEAAQAQLPVKLSEIAAKLGINLIASTLPSGISGELRPENGQFIVKVNRHDSKGRQRFTVAHEIAHFLLHRDQIGGGIADDVLYRSGLSDHREAEANKLAAEILMPRYQIKAKQKEFEANGITQEDMVTAMALAFGVSEPAMRIRLDLD